jgi:hypothetical protein
MVSIRMGLPSLGAFKDDVFNIGETLAAIAKLAHFVYKAAVSRISLTSIIEYMNNSIFLRLLCRP